MNTEVLIAPLRQVALFEGLAPSQLAAIAKTAERIVFKPGDTLIRDGRDAGGALIVVSGDAERLGLDGAGARIEPGSMLAEMSMFVDTEASATVVARSPVRALRLDRQAMLEQLATDPSLADYFVARISSRLKDVADELRRVDRTLGGEGAMEAEWSPVDGDAPERSVLH